jgi:hypothetical protein
MTHLSLYCTFEPFTTNNKTQTNDNRHGKHKQCRNYAINNREHIFIFLKNHSENLYELKHNENSKTQNKAFHSPCLLIPSHATIINNKKRALLEKSKALLE